MEPLHHCGPSQDSIRPCCCRLYAWEDPFKAQIISLRTEELRHIRRSGYLQVANVFIFLGVRSLPCHFP